jgi:uncharacterized protein with PIN domain
MNAMAVPKLLLDEMLKGLVKWLRAAGYDTADDADGVADEALLARAIAEDRLLVTLDRALAESDTSGRVLLLDCNDNPECAAELSHRLGVNWLYKPFSRCIVCNSPLQKASPEQRNRVPQDIQKKGGEILYCPRCDRIYWDGGHVARMRHHLRLWAEQFNPSQSSE